MPPPEFPLSYVKPLCVTLPKDCLFIFVQDTTHTPFFPRQNPHLFGNVCSPGNIRYNELQAQAEA